MSLAAASLLACEQMHAGASSCGRIACMALRAALRLAAPTSGFLYTSNWYWCSPAITLFIEWTSDLLSAACSAGSEAGSAAARARSAAARCCSARASCRARQPVLGVRW